MSSFDMQGLFSHDLCNGFNVNLLSIKYVLPMCLFNQALFIIASKIFPNPILSQGSNIHICKFSHTISFLEGILYMKLVWPSPI